MKKNQKKKTGTAPAVPANRETDAAAAVPGSAENAEIKASAATTAKSGKQSFPTPDITEFVRKYSLCITAVLLAVSVLMTVLFVSEKKNHNSDTEAYLSELEAAAVSVETADRENLLAGEMLEETQQQLDALQTEYDALAAEKTALEKQTAELTEKKDELSAQTGTLTGTVSGLNSGITALNAELDNIKAEKSALEDKLAESEETAASLNSRISSLLEKYYDYIAFINERFGADAADIDMNDSQARAEANYKRVLACLESSGYSYAANESARNATCSFTLSGKYEKVELVVTAYDSNIYFLALFPGQTEDDTYGELCKLVTRLNASCRLGSIYLNPNYSFLGYSAVIYSGTDSLASPDAINSALHTVIASCEYYGDALYEVAVRGKPAESGYQKLFSDK